MQRALNLSLKGLGHTLHNPLVGCLLVHRDKIISEGYHSKYGGPHAEKMCLDRIDPPPGCTLFVNMEPCCHYGKTPPCTDLIIEKRISRVVISTMDPNPLVNGKGIEILRNNDIEVINGILEAKALYLNRAYFHYMKYSSPYITLKLGSTLDGKIADREKRSQWITNEKSRIKAHWLRGINRAVHVGLNTLFHDRPRLSTRYPYRQMPTPLRVIIDRNLKLKESMDLLNDKRDTILYTYKAPPDTPFSSNVLYVMIDEGTDIISEAVKDLGKRSISTLLVEGGGETAFEFLNRKLVNELHITYSPRILGGEKSVSSFSGEGFLLENSVKLKDYRIYRFEEDFEVEGIIED